ncbi:MAG: D-glycerate dehydrogenase [Proteobacteria bacterium]|nr:D-glycerate dehydrogenase [Pseudomonadota bacterium]
MTKFRPAVVITRRLPEVIEERMAELFDVTIPLNDKAMSDDQLAAAMNACDVLLPTVTDRIDADLIARAGPRLKLIANFGNGVDNIDVAAARKRGITVTNTPGVLTEDMADFTMALIVAVARRFSEGARIIPGGGWSGWSPTWMLGRRVTGKRIGIVGMGRIGQAVARRARAFGLQVHYHNRRPVSARTEEELQATYWESLDRMLARMDIITIHCPHTPATFHLLSARRLQLLKADAILVNTARGEIVDTDELTNLLEAGHLAGAGLDVYEHEPAISDRLLKLADEGRVLLLPHMGSSTVESRIEMGEKVIINIKTFIDGHTPPDRVLPQL